MHDNSVFFLLQLDQARTLSGYLASSLVLATFCAKSMRTLRWIGIASNLCFITYAVLAALPPILILHALLLPLNLYRLIELERARSAHRLPQPATAKMTELEPRQALSSSC